MKGNILVSIICTTYNHEKYIRSALEGFVMQKTNFPFEVLINDDASTDGTAAIIREYAEKYPDIIIPVYQTENQYSKKVLITEEILMPKAKGKYFAFCEGDDFWTDENKLQMQVDFLESNPEYVACVHNTTIKTCNSKKSDELVSNHTEAYDITFENIVHGLKNGYQTSSVVTRKDAFSNLPDFCYIAYRAGFGDFPNAIWFTIIGKVRFLPNNMSTYRFMSTSNSWSAKTYTKHKLISHIEVLIEMFENIKKHVSSERVNILQKIILEHKFNLLELKKEYSKLRKPPYDEIWENKPLIFKIKIYVKQWCPWLYKMLGKIK